MWKNNSQNLESEGITDRFLKSAMREEAMSDIGNDMSSDWLTEKLENETISSGELTEEFLEQEVIFSELIENGDLFSSELSDEEQTLAQMPENEGLVSIRWPGETEEAECTCCPCCTVEEEWIVEDVGVGWVKQAEILESSPESTMFQLPMQLPSQPSTFSTSLSLRSVQLF